MNLKSTLSSILLCIALLLITSACASEPQQRSSQATTVRTPSSANQTELTPRLLSVSPVHGSHVGLDFQPCATFDISVESDLGLTAEKLKMAYTRFLPKLFVEGIEFPINSISYSGPDDDQGVPTARAWCLDSFRHILERKMPVSIQAKEGALHVEVQYEDVNKTEYRYAWEVFLEISASEAPPEVKVIRDTHRLVEEAKEIAPGIGGYYSKNRVLSVYVQDNANESLVQQAIESVLRKAKAPLRTLKVVKSQYNASEVYGMYRAAQDAVYSNARAYMSDYDEVSNRIVFGVASEYAAHKGREALSKQGIPQEIVYFQVPEKFRPNVPPTAEDSYIGIDISLDFPPDQKTGTPMFIEVVLINSTDKDVSFEHGTPFYEDVVIFDMNGDEVWRKLFGVLQGTGGSTTLRPGEKMRLHTYWELIDQDEFALPPGKYLARAITHILYTEHGFIRVVDFATRPYEFSIER